MVRHCQSTLAGEFGSVRAAGAEGATAPEPLRQKDRKLMALWKVTAVIRRPVHRRG